MTSPITANDEHLAFLTLYRSNEPRMTMARVEEIEVNVAGLDHRDFAVVRGVIVTEAQRRNPGKLVINPYRIEIETMRLGYPSATAKVVVLDMVDARDD